MSRTRQVLWASALSGASVFVAMAAWLVITKLATRQLSGADFAVFLLVQTWADALNILANLGLAVSLPRIIASAPEPEREHTAGAAMAGTALVSLAVALLGGALWWGCASAVGAWAGDDAARFARYAWLVPPLFFVGAMRDTAMAALAGLHRFTHRAASIVIASIVSMIAAGFFTWRGSTSVAAFSGAMVLGHGLNLLWLYAALPPHARWQSDLPAYRRAVAASIALYQNNLLTFVYQRVDTLLAQRYIGLEGVKLLGTAKYLPTILSRVTAALHVPLLPNLAGLVAQDDLATASRVMNRALALTTVLCYTATLGATALAGPILRLIAQPAYAEAAPVVPWLMTAMSLAIQTGIFGLGLIAQGRPAAVTRANTALAAISVGLNLWLLPRYGFLGAGLTATIAIVFSLAIQASVVHRHGLKIALRPWFTAHALFLAGMLFVVGAPSPLATLAILPAFALLCVVFGALPLAEVRGLLALLSRHR